ARTHRHRHAVEDAVRRLEQLRLLLVEYRLADHLLVDDQLPKRLGEEGQLFTLYQCGVFAGGRDKTLFLACTDVDATVTLVGRQRPEAVRGEDEVRETGHFARGLALVLDDD